jgi:DNA transformation protein and related proteins
MAVSDDYLHYVLDQLAGLGHLASRRMFGGVGLYHDERFFALISRDTLYFKVNDSNRRHYEERGMERFRPFDDKPQWSMTYYTVPADVLEDAEECVIWARKSVATATVAQKPAARRTTKTRKRRTPASRKN